MENKGFLVLIILFFTTSLIFSIVVSPIVSLFILDKFSEKPQVNENPNLDNLQVQIRELKDAINNLKNNGQNNNDIDRLERIINSLEDNLEDLEDDLDEQDDDLKERINDLKDIINNNILPFLPSSSVS